MSHSETTLDSRPVFEGRVFTVAFDRVRLENGAESTREVVHHHGGACIAALTDEGEIYLVRQYRYALGQELWELPAGKLEKGEDPFAAAKRELAEEYFLGFCRGGEFTLHLRQLAGKNTHHILEAAFKGFGRAMAIAVAPDSRRPDALPSTKGVL